MPATWGPVWAGFVGSLAAGCMTGVGALPALLGARALRACARRRCSASPPA
ncbi:MAG: hypothetical protein U5K43_07410 [Halofilum sp. (in: g-proteobacteria)]|nr:hypothetical protein [Halofilum sp. (in: g-proteobacteria)]